MSSPDEQPVNNLDAIRARADAATPGPWGQLPEVGPHWIGGESSPVGKIDFGEGAAADADRAFVLHARQDVEDLLAKVDRLTAELGTARRQERERCARAISRLAKSQNTAALRFVVGLGANRIRALPDEDTPAIEWDAVYEPGNVSTVHIGRFPTWAEATTAAETWHRANSDDPGPIFWERLREPEGWRLVERHDPCTESGIRVRRAGSERLFLCPSCGTTQPLETSRRRDDYGQRWCRICDDVTPERPARTTTEAPR